jgi:hypothetical protein
VFIDDVLLQRGVLAFELCGFLGSWGCWVGDKSGLWKLLIYSQSS